MYIYTYRRGKKDAIMVECEVAITKYAVILNIQTIGSEWIKRSQHKMCGSNSSCHFVYSRIYLVRSPRSLYRDVPALPHDATTLALRITVKKSFSKETQKERNFPKTTKINRTKCRSNAARSVFVYSRLPLPSMAPGLMVHRDSITRNVTNNESVRPDFLAKERSEIVYTKKKGGSKYQ